MLHKKNVLASARWAVFVARRLSRVDRNGRAAATSRLASLGIALGVMTLIVVTGVMNGFQMGFKDAIMEISSGHVRAFCADKSDEPRLEALAAESENIRSCVPFFEAESLAAGKSGRQAAAFIRAASESIMRDDPGFARELRISSGSFDVSSAKSIVLGSALAYSLGVRVGDTVTLIAMSGSNDSALFSSDRKFTVTGIFHSGYADINSSFAFIGIKWAKEYLGESARKIYMLKLKRPSADAQAISSIESMLPNVSCESWREYNRSFFGVLRVEKNMLMMITLLVFVVAAVNIYNGMRRLVFEKKSEISILSALGGGHREIQMIFTLRGFLMGLSGAAAGVAAGLLVCANMKSVFLFAGGALYAARYLAAMVVSPERAALLSENPMFALYASIPARVFASEIFLTALFGIAAPLAASFAASGAVLKMNPAEVLRDE